MSFNYGLNEIKALRHYTLNVPAIPCFCHLLTISQLWPLSTLLIKV